MSEWPLLGAESVGRQRWAAAEPSDPLVKEEHVLLAYILWEVTAWCNLEKPDVFNVNLNFCS